MTREEAIKVLLQHIEHWKRLLTENICSKEEGSQTVEALEMAIQALSQEPCDDTVSIRKDVLKYRVGKLVVYNVEWLKKHWQMEMDIVCGAKMESEVNNG